MFLSVYRIIATFFCAGYAPKAPGTVGTIAALPLYAIMKRLSLPRYLLATAILTLLGVFVSGKMEEHWGNDPSQVVIDEVVGLLITLVSRPKGWKEITLGVLLFRVFDIIKPPPVGYVDRNVHGGLGIMADDMIAGGISALLLLLVPKRVLL
jgi:phosphatidylglycerophosphatase A